MQDRTLAVTTSIDRTAIKDFISRAMQEEHAQEAIQTTWEHITKTIALGVTVEVGDLTSLTTHINTRINEKAKN